MRHTKWLVGVVLVVAAGVGAWLLWSKMQPHGPGPGFASANGRIEATEIDVATKLAGRIVDELVDEGDLVTARQVVAHMDTESLEAQLREAKAKLAMAKSAVDTARSTLAQRQWEKAAAESVVAQREADVNLATSEFSRAQQLLPSHAISQSDFDTEQSKFYSAKAAASSAKANVAAADAAIATAKTLVIAAQAAVEATQATIERIQADINDSTLKAPRGGRVQYRVSQPGEVLNAGGKVLNMVDLNDVYMTFFLPTDWAGRVKLGAEVRLVLDAAPQFVIPAKVTFVADVAQFTPKTAATWPTRASARRLARASPTCRRVWARTSIRRCRSSRTPTSSPGCSARDARSATAASPSCWTVSGWDASPTGRPASCPAA